MPHLQCGAAEAVAGAVKEEPPLRKEPSPEETPALEADWARRAAAVVVVVMAAF